MKNPENLSKKQEDLLTSIMENVPVATEITLNFPSESKFYKLQDPEKPVTIRPMNYEDEIALVSLKDEEGYDPLNLILDRCLNNISVYELLEMDKLYALIKLREISYGDSYRVNVICPKCKEENPLTIKLSKDLNILPIPDDLEDPREVLLPTINKPAIVKFPRVRDEQYQATGGAVSNMWRFVTSIGGIEDKGVIAEAIKQMPIKDRQTLRNAIRGEDFGVETKIKLKCGKCEKLTIIDLPLGEGFFDVS